MTNDQRSSLGPFRPGDHVRIKNNALAWQITSIDEENKEAILVSGNYSRTRLEKIENLRLWGSEYRG